MTGGKVYRGVRRRKSIWTAKKEREKKAAKREKDKGENYVKGFKAKENQIKTKKIK